MAEDFSKNLRDYARLIVKHGANVQTDQMVLVTCEPYHRKLALLVAEEAYGSGAKYVDINYGEPYNKRLRIQKSSPEALNFLPRYVSEKYRELVDHQGASISIIGEEEPELLADLDTKKINISRLAQYHALKYFYEEGVDKSKVHWTVAAAATPKWAQKIFKDKSPAQAEELLWQHIFRICRLGQSNFLEAWERHQEDLQKKAQQLTDLKIATIHFSGPGTDLTVGLSPQAIFRGGGEKSARGIYFSPNLPTEECFTTPDFRKTEGHVAITRPFLVNGVRIRGLELEFKRGEITDFKAKEGEETFREYIQSDAGAKRLGEVALVGTDSPVYQSGLVFEEILYDENAACHIAIGSAYHFCLENGPGMPKTELSALGCNDSTVHTDMMISSDQVQVKAQTFDGKQINLLKNGGWVVQPRA